MDQLRFIGVHADGTHLMMADDEGTEYAVALDERLQTALRRSRADAERPTTPVTPREVQSMIRAGLSSEEISEQTDWEQQRVQRYEGPILAEREHVALMACAAHVRTHDRTGPPPSLQGRVEQRLAARGVDMERVRWDATRPEGGQWSVVVTFVAGQRSRQASWRFDPSARSTDALDDEARWLSEDEQTLPRDVNAETVFGGQTDSPEDLMTSMRERSRKRGRSRRPRQGRARSGEHSDRDASAEGADAVRIGTGDTEAGSHDPVSVPGGGAPPGEALPLEDFPYDPDTMGLPPSAHGHADRSEADPEDAHPEEDPKEDHETSREATLADFFGDPDDEQGGESEPDGEGQGAPAPTQESEDAGYAGRKRARPSVPSWDDIMFGARDRGR
ncbi:MAG: septation protein SepH [Ornithinimicrobium sp.]|uniref:septation protein SepH n=1 Tax=Ornithinimicrobium sp. TaxID=1977084 RepID=UPI003D9B1709